jgi:hypothetical protein
MFLPLLLLGPLLFLQNFLPLSAAKYEQVNNFPSRYQWGENMGYCGEVSLIVAGLSLGQYISQYDSRIAACDTKSQSRCEMLLGVNDQSAATKMHLTSSEWGTVKQRNTEDFLVWVKQNVLRGYPVIIGVYMNYYKFYDVSTPSAGDADYDHIVPVIGIRSNHPLTDTTTYYEDDEIIFSDNGLWGVPTNPPYVFNYTFADFPHSRSEANDKNGEVYSLPNTASNYGMMITGLSDSKQETLPVRVDTNVNYEKPEMKEGSNDRPASMAVTLTVTVSKMTPNTNYMLYRYNSLAAVPESGFKEKASNAVESWKISSDTGSYSMSKTIQSNEIAVFRCVKA